MISIILPVYNEEQNITKTVSDIENFFAIQKIDYEIIAVNDGSIDKTDFVLNNIKSKISRLIIASHKNNLGYGAALKTGFLKANGNLIFFMDSDGQFNIKDIAVFLEKIDRYDFVIGYRNKRADSFLRILNAKIFNFACFLFFGVKAKDIDCAFKLFKKDILQNLNLFSDGALINIEILAKLQKRNYKYFQLPVSHYKRIYGKSTGANPKVILKAVFNFFILFKKIKDFK